MLVLAVAWGNLENRDDVISRAVTYYPGDAESGASFGTEFSFDATTIGTNRSSHTRTFSMGNSYEIIKTMSLLLLNPLKPRSLIRLQRLILLATNQTMRI